VVVVDGKHAIVLNLIRAKARHVSSAVRQSKKLRRVGKEKLRCQPVPLVDPVINIRIELIFSIGRTG